jgi:hypothetical protein
MDDNPNVSQMRSSDSTLSPVRSLTRIIALEWPPARLEWIWNMIQTQDYAFDDLSKGNAQVFLGPLFNDMNEWYEIGDDGIVMINGIVPKCQAFIHFALWGDIDIRELFPLQRELFNDLFQRHELNRLTAFIPAFNKQAIRFATLTGFKYEGELRKVFLKHGTYHNTHFYGLLRSEFYLREVKH